MINLRIWEKYFFFFVTATLSSILILCSVSAHENLSAANLKNYFNSRRENPWDTNSDVSWWAQPILDQNSTLFCWSFSSASAAAHQLNRLLNEAGKLNQSSVVRFDPFYNGWLQTHPSMDVDWGSNTFIKPDIVFDNPFDTAVNQLGGEFSFFISTLRWGLKKMEGDDVNLAPVVNTNSFTTLNETFYLVWGPLNRDQETQKNVKDKLEKYGSLTVSLHMPQNDDSLIKIMNDGLILNSDENLPVNHQVLLVGWNDEFEFEGTNKKGAWLIQNSWGTDFCCYSCQKDQGYLYVPYDDLTLSNLGIILPETDRFKYTTLETASGGALSHSISFTSTFNFVNRHHSSDNQLLRSVTFFNPAEDSGFKIKIYNDKSELIGEQSGKFGQEGLEKGIGMRTIELEQLLLLPKDKTYYVEICYLLENGQEGFVLASHIDRFTGLVPSMESWILDSTNGYVQEEGFAVELFTRGRNTLEALGKDFSLSWMDTGHNSNIVINLGSATEQYKGDLLDESRKTLSNMTLNLKEGQVNDFGGTIIGEGSFTKKGLGVLNFSGSNYSSGVTRVEEGTVLANGYFASNVSILPLGRLGGTGKIQGTLDNQGVVAPGNSIGALTVNRYIQSEDGILELEFSAGSCDRLIVLQDASLKGEIAYIARGFLPTGTHALTTENVPSFITAKEMIVDPAIEISSSSRLDNSLTVNVITDGRGTFEVNRSPDAYSKFALSNGARNSAAILDKLSNGRFDKKGEEFLGFIDEMHSAERIASALEILNSDPYREELATSVYRGRKLSNLLFLNSLANNCSLPNNENENVRLKLSGVVFGSAARFSGANGYQSSKDRLGGFYLDLSDSCRDRAHGVSVGLYHAATSSNDQLSWKAKTTGVFASARLHWEPEYQKGVSVLISGYLGYEDSKLKRPTSFEGFYDSHAGRFDLATFALRGALGYTIPLGNIHFTPLSYLENTVGIRSSFKESGNYPLAFKHTVINSFYSGLGGRLEASHTFENKNSFHIGIEGFWEHSLLDKQKTKLKLFGDETRFHYKGYTSKELFRFGIDAEFRSQKMSLKISGEGARSSDIKDISVNFQLSRSF